MHSLDARFASRRAVILVYKNSVEFVYVHKCLNGFVSFGSSESLAKPIYIIVDANSVNWRRSSSLERVRPERAAVVRSGTVKFTMKFILSSLTSFVASCTKRVTFYPGQSQWRVS